MLLHGSTRHDGKKDADSKTDTESQRERGILRDEGKEGRRETLNPKPETLKPKT